MATGTMQKPSTQEVSKNKDGSPRAPRTKLAPLTVDLNNVELKATEDIRRGSASNALEGTPIVGWVRNARESGVAKGKQGDTFLIPVSFVEEEAKTMESLLRAAAAQLNIGIKIERIVAKDGKIALKFQPKNKSVRKPTASA